MVSDTGSRARLVVRRTGCTVATAVLLAPAVACIVILASPGWGVQRFDAALWRSSASSVDELHPRGGHPRGRMVWRLLGSGRLNRKTHAEVLAELGPPTYAEDLDGRPPARGHLPKRYLYALGGPPEWMLSKYGPEYLVVEFGGSRDVVVSCYVIDA